MASSKEHFPARVPGQTPEMTTFDFTGSFQVTSIYQFYHNFFGRNNTRKNKSTDTDERDHDQSRHFLPSPTTTTTNLHRQTTTEANKNSGLEAAVSRAGYQYATRFLKRFRAALHQTEHEMGPQGILSASGGDGCDPHGATNA